MAQIKDFVVKQGLVAEGNAQSDSTASGALIVAGGAGIGGNVNIGGSIKRTGDVIGGTFVQGAQLSLGDARFTDSLTSGRVAWGVTNYFGSSVLDTVSTNATYTNAATVFIKGAPTEGDNLTIEKAWAVYANSGSFYIGETSGNTTTQNDQALQVAGGISFGNGIYGLGGGSLFGYFEINSSEVLTRANVNVGQIEFPDGIRITTSTQATSTITGALIVDNNGGVGVGGNVYVGGYLAVLTTGTFLSTTAAQSTQTGALTIKGGLGVGQDIYARNTILVSGDANTATVAGNSLQILSGGGLGVSGTARIEGQVWLTDATDSTELGQGALVVRGGASIEQNLTVETARVRSNNLAIDVTNAAFAVDGGVGIAGNLIVGSSGSSTGTTATNALQVAGGGYFGGDLTVQGDTVIKGDLLLLGQGSQVTINSTSTYIVDPVIEIGGGVDGAMLQVPDIYDKGLLIHYQNQASTLTDYRAFIGLENTTERVIFKQDIIPGVDGADPYGDYYNSGTWSTLEAGSLVLRDTTPSTDGITGALIVAGGAALGGPSTFVSTATFTSAKYSLSQIADNAVQVPNGGLGAQYLYIEQDAWVNGAQVLTTGTVNNNIGGIFTATFAFVNTTPSNSTNTGAVTVTGGVGIGGNLYVGGNEVLTGTLTVLDATQSDDTSTGAVVVTGGVGIGKNLNVGGTVRITDGTATDSTTSNNGALVVDGGVGIKKDLVVSGNTTITQTLNVQTLRVTSTTDSSDKTSGAATVAGGLGVAETIHATRAVLDTASINSGTNSSSTTTGDLTVVGGVGIGQDVYVGGNTRILSTETAINTTTGALIVQGGVAVVEDMFVAGRITRSGTVSTNAINKAGVGLSLSTSTYIDAGSMGANAGFAAIHSVGRPTIIGSLNPNYDDAATLYIDGQPLFTGGATASSAWALFIANGNVKVGSNTNNNGTTSSGALQVSGGVGVGGNLTAGGTVKGLAVKVDDNLITSPKITGKSTNAPVLIDTYVGNEFTTAKYLVQVVDIDSPNKFHVVELMVTYDGSGASSGVYISQYGIITNTGELGSFDVSYNAGDIQIVFTPNYTPVSMSIRAVRFAIVT
jgi:hypothetical protein